MLALPVQRWRDAFRALVFLSTMYTIPEARYSVGEDKVFGLVGLS
jgi:hypothetical protein